METISSVQTNLDNGVFTHAPNEKSKGKFWASFHQIFNEGVLVKKFVYCTKCKKVFNYDTKKGNSNLNSHSASCNDLTKTIHSFLPRVNTVSICTEDKKKICAKTIATVVIDNPPFNFLMGTGVIDLLHTIWQMGARLGAITKNELENALPGGTTIRRNINALSEKCKEELKEKLITELENGATLALTTDIWQDKYKRMSYLCLTVHLCESTTNVLTDFVLAMQPMDPKRKKDNIHVREIIMAKLVSFGIEKYVKHFTFISDRGGNIRVALQDFVRLNCFPHFLHSIVKHACQVESVKELIDSCASLVKYFKFNGLNNLLDWTLKSAISTRFNYVIMMLDSIYKQYDAVKKILQDRNESIRLRNIDSNHIEKLVEFLKPFQDASRFTEANNKPTLSYVWLGISEVTMNCCVKDTDAQFIKAMKARALGYIETKFILHKYHRIATFLNPNHKNLDFTTPELRRRTIDDTRAMVNELTRRTHSSNTNDTSISSSSSSTSSIRRTSSDSASSFLSNYYSQNESPEVIDEIDTYISMNCIPDPRIDVLDWWVSRKNIFPRLAKIAVMVHSIPASSLQSERHFSRCGITLTDRRSRMCPETLENVMILNRMYNFEVSPIDCKYLIDSNYF